MTDTIKRLRSGGQLISWPSWNSKRRPRSPQGSESQVGIIRTLEMQEFKSGTPGSSQKRWGLLRSLQNLSRFRAQNLKCFRENQRARLKDQPSMGRTPRKSARAPLGKLGTCGALSARHADTRGSRASPERCCLPWPWRALCTHHQQGPGVPHPPH